MGMVDVNWKITAQVSDGPPVDHCVLYLLEKNFFTLRCRCLLLNVEQESRPDSLQGEVKLNACKRSEMHCHKVRQKPAAGRLVSLSSLTEVFRNV